MSVQTENLVRVCRWITDLRRGEMIESRLVKRGYIHLENTTGTEMSTLCTIANTYIINQMEEFFRLEVSFGEIIPVYYKEGQTAPIT